MDYYKRNSWRKSFGIPGLILGVPVVVLLKTVLEGSMEMRLIEKGKEDIEKTNLRK